MIDAVAEAEAPQDHLSRWKARQPRQTGTANGGGAVYGLGLLGALAYFFGSARSGQEYLLAAPTALFWPAIVVYRLLGHLNG
jgi:hypothetical protein